MLYGPNCVPAATFEPLSSRSALPCCYILGLCTDSHGESRSVRRVLALRSACSNNFCLCREDLDIGEKHRFSETECSDNPLGRIVAMSYMCFVRIAVGPRVTEKLGPKDSSAQLPHGGQLDTIPRFVRLRVFWELLLFQQRFRLVRKHFEGKTVLHPTGIAQTKTLIPTGPDQTLVPSKSGSSDFSGFARSLSY
jgi:hypothetical protein